MSSDLLRMWERRCAILNPQRTGGNQRLYSLVDEARLRLMLRHVRGGVPAAQAAELATAAKFRLTPSATSRARIDHGADAGRQILAALARYDETAAEQVLEWILGRFTATTVIRDVLLPFLHQEGVRWTAGHVGVAQEHFASGFIRSRLLALARGWDRGLGPHALLAAPPNEQHIFGLIAFGIALPQAGWRITYLGADTPVPMIAEAAASVGSLGPRLTVVAAVMPERLDHVRPQLRDLPDRWPIAIGGAGTSRQLADRCGARHLPTDPVTAAQSVFG